MGICVDANSSCHYQAKINLYLANKTNNDKAYHSVNIRDYLLYLIIVMQPPVNPLLLNLFNVSNYLIIK
jgi:hypothetical protein